LPRDVLEEAPREEYDSREGPICSSQEQRRASPIKNLEVNKDQLVQSNKKRDGVPYLYALH